MAQVKFNYTNGDEFQLSGEDYIGYFNINDSGDAYTGRYFDVDSHILLTPESVYSADYYRSSNFRDRFVFDSLALPNSRESILIGAGEIVNYASINSKIKLLHDNLIYLHSKMFMGDTNSPVDDSYYVMCNVLETSSYGWNQTPFAYGSFSDVHGLSAFSEFDNLKRFVVIPMKGNIGYSIFGISTTHLVALTSQLVSGVPTNAQITLYTDVIDNNSNEKCINLEDIVYDGVHLYVTDSRINGGGQVFKYDVTAYYTNDPTFENKAFLVETIGGSGGISKNSKFNGCSVLGHKTDEVLVYDSGNNSIKIFDSNFVWKMTFKIPSTAKYKILDIKHRKLNNHIYLLYKNETNVSYGLFEYDENYRLIGNYIFSDVLDPITDISFNRLSFSSQDSNVFYVTTNGTVYKKFFSSPEKTFSIFSREKFYPQDSFRWNLVHTTWEETDRLWNESAAFKLNLTLKDIAVVEDESNADDLFLLGGPSCIYRLQERTDYQSVLRNTNLKYYNYNRIQLDKKEYNQSLTINKELYKLFSNIIQFKNTLKGRFFFEFDKYGELIIRDFAYFTDDEINILSVDLDYDCYVNDNELVQPNVLNRMLNKLYDFQENVIDFTNVKILNLKTAIQDNNVYLID